MQVPFRFSDHEDIEISKVLPHTPLFLWGIPEETSLPYFLKARDVKLKLRFSINTIDDEGIPGGNTPPIHYDNTNWFENIVISSNSTEVLSMSRSSFMQVSNNLNAPRGYLPSICNARWKSPDFFEQLKGSPKVYLFILIWRSY